MECVNLKKARRSILNISIYINLNSSKVRHVLIDKILVTKFATVKASQNLNLI